MKLFRRIFTLAIVALSLFAACDSPSRLASKIEGSWSGSPERVTNTNISYLAVTPDYQFARDNSASHQSGTVTLTLQVEATFPVDSFPEDSLGYAPVSMNIAAVSTIEGTWTATDDDVIKLHFDSSSLLTSVDSKAVMQYTSELVDTDTPVTEELPVALLRTIQTQIDTSVASYISDLSEFDNVKFRTNTLLTTINAIPTTLTR